MITFVWPWWRGGARGDELKFSIRSVAMQCRFDWQPLVVGDIPDWYNGPVISIARKPNKKWTNWADTVSKMYAICQSQQVSRQFIYMNDDMYFLRPFDLDDVTPFRSIKKYSRTSKPKSQKWLTIQWETMQRLKKAGFPAIWHCTTHSPQWFDKQKMLMLLRTLNASKKPIVLDLAYNNAFRSDEPRQRYGRDVARLRGAFGQVAAIRYRSQNKLILNHVSAGFTEAMQVFLESQFPIPSSFEVDPDNRWGCKHRRQSGTITRTLCPGKGSIRPTFECNLFDQPCFLEMQQSPQRGKHCKLCILEGDCEQRSSHNHLQNI